MFGIRYVTEADKKFWFTLDQHISNEEFLLKIRDPRGYLILDSNKPIGIMRYNLFWDNLPFLTLIYLKNSIAKKDSEKKLSCFGKIKCMRPDTKWL